MSKKKTSIFDLPIYIFAIGAALLVLDVAFWFIVIGAIVFVAWMVICEMIKG